MGFDVAGEVLMRGKPYPGTGAHVLDEFLEDAHAPWLASAKRVQRHDGRETAMKQSTTRILTTHTGSLPRPQDLLNLLIEEQARPGTDRTALDAAIQRAVAEVVHKQAEHGLDVINDGEQGRVDYTVYIKDRLTGFDGESAPPLGTGDEEFPELAAMLRQFASPFQRRPACTGLVTWKDWPAVEADIGNLKAAIANVPAEEFFMTSPSSGQIARFLYNQYFADEETYLYALADVMKAQYHYANVVGREHMLAGVDGGFGTFAGRIQVDSKIVWLKLQALTEGAKLASQELCRLRDEVDKARKRMARLGVSRIAGCRHTSLPELSLWAGSTYPQVLHTLTAHDVVADVRGAVREVGG
jgi:hypothetical protein